MIRVLIVEDTRPVGERTSTILGEQTEIQVIGNYPTIRLAQPVIANADVVLASTGLSGDGAYQLARASSRGEFQAGVLILGQSDSADEILRYFEAGARGYFRRDDLVVDLLNNIRSIYQGEAILAPELASRVLSRLSELSRRWEAFLPLPGKLACLTPREREVLHLIARDFTNQDIADRLIIEVGTVKNHVHNILSKLNVRSRHEAARFLPALQTYINSDLLFHIPQTVPAVDPISRG